MTLRTLVATLLGAVAAVHASPSSAQNAAVPPPPPVVPAPITDAVRLRSGFGVHAGVASVDTVNDKTPLGGAFGVSLRLGVQFSHLFGLYYQGMPEVMVVWQNNQTSAHLSGFVSVNNSLLASLTLLDVLDLGAGPSVDWVGALRCGASTQSLPGCDTREGVHWGAHGRVSLLLGGRSGRDVRRSGLALSVDLHSTWLTEGLLLTATGGVGAEWY